jgi:hypothetical protein
MDEPRQLDRDPSRKASWNWLLGNRKAGLGLRPDHLLGRSHSGRESLNGLEGSKSAIGRPRGKYPGFLFKLLPWYLSRFMQQKGWGSARAPFYRVDLVWCNFAASIQGSFQGAHIDWAGSLGLDHALICTIASTPIRLSQHREDRTNRFDMSMSAEEWKEWD